MSDPVEDLRAACERIKNATGESRPNVILIPAWLPGRMRESVRAKIANAERMLGIGCEPEGKFPTGWPWTKRAGRPSKEEKRLRDCLPGWRSMLKGLRQPIEIVRDGQRAEATIGDLECIDQESKLLSMVKGYDTYEVLMPPDTDAPGRWVPITNPNMHDYSNIVVERTNRRPTGKRAQRRAGKEWNR